jgi:hypothetical protein
MKIEIDGYLAQDLSPRIILNVGGKQRTLTITEVRTLIADIRNEMARLYAAREPACDEACPYGGTGPDCN